MDILVHQRRPAKFEGEVHVYIGSALHSTLHILLICYVVSCDSEEGGGGDCTCMETYEICINHVYCMWYENEFTYTCILFF